MHHAGYFLGKALLHRALTGVGGVLGGEGSYLVLVEEGEYLEVFLGVGIVDVKPELIEFVGAGVACVEPYVAALGLSEFASVGLGDEGTGEGEYFAAELAADELGACGDVAPLVRAAELQLAVFSLIEVQEVVSLEQLICEFGEREAVARLAVETFLHRLLGHHIVDGKVLAYVADEVEECYVLCPVIVVDHLGAVGRV